MTSSVHIQLNKPVDRIEIKGVLANNSQQVLQFVTGDIVLNVVLGVEWQAKLLQAMHLRYPDGAGASEPLEDEEVEFDNGLTLFRARR